jgi:hypothetical protein
MSVDFKRRSDNKMRATAFLSELVPSLIVGAAALIAISIVANASDAAPTTQKKLVASATNTSAQAGTGHGKNLNFDGDYVETMGKNPLDSLTALSESQRNRNTHLYRKRSEFAPETAETLKQSRFEQ